MQIKRLLPQLRINFLGCGFFILGKLSKYSYFIYLSLLVPSDNIYNGYIVIKITIYKFNDEIILGYIISKGKY